MQGPHFENHRPSSQTHNIRVGMFPKIRLLTRVSNQKNLDAYAVRAFENAADSIQSIIKTQASTHF